MTSRLDRTSTTILLCAAIVLAHAGAGLLLYRSWRTSYPASVPSNVFWELLLPLQNDLLIVGESATKVEVGVIDRSTSQIRKLDIPLLCPCLGIVSDGTRVWFVMRNAMLEVNATDHVRHVTQRGLMSPISFLFLYHGEPAIVDLDDAGVKYRLYVFHEGDWQDRGEVGIPGHGRTWAKNETSGQMQLEPCAGCAQSTGVRGSEYLRVVTKDDVHHLVFCDYANRVVAYREGFDWIPTRDDVEVTSALVPENVPADTTGWT